MTPAWYVPIDEIKPLSSPTGADPIFIWQAFPWLKHFYLPVELSMQHAHMLARRWRSNPWIPLLIVAFYLAGIYYGQRYMSKRPARDLRKPLAAWNLSLSIFSLLGTLRTAPYVFYWLYHIGFKELTCADPFKTHGERDIGVWVMFFALSKLVEFGDTAFVILRKKPLPFVHWYHHTTVALFCYYCFTLHVPGLPFIVMNYAVHTLMYFYFFLMAVGKVPKWLNPRWITTAQISQMLVGVYVSTWQAYWTFTGQCAHGNVNVCTGALLMYASYLYLFVDFFVSRFILKKGRHEKEKDATGAGVGQEEVEKKRQ